MHADDQNAQPDDAAVSPPADDGVAAVAEADGPIPPAQDALSSAGAEPAGRSGLFWRFALALIAIDQITKVMVRGAVPLFETRPLVPGFIDLVHVRNEGVAFGLLNTIDLPYKWVLTTALAVGALLGIAYYANYVRREERLARLGLSMILGGAIGNLLDRALQGYVLDFFDVYWGTWHFWAINVADASISIGAILVFADLLLVKPHASRSV
ncbi:MAG TPA: signal peptidase II [Vicinamibacterales bacterium]|nr:signal peptidase II [Vicinamibacterales bacterium]